jgi:hypothetical protein
MRRNRILCSSAAALALVFLSACSQKKEPAVNPTGTWDLKTLSAGSQAVTPQTLSLKLEGGKLTGTLSRQAGAKLEQVPFDDAQLKGSEISFSLHVYALHYENNVLQPTDTNMVTYSTYQGQISGDTMKGKVEKKSWHEENSRTLDWEATRVKSTAP